MIMILRTENPNLCSRRGIYTLFLEVMFIVFHSFRSHFLCFPIIDKDNELDPCCQTSFFYPRSSIFMASNSCLLLFFSFSQVCNLSCLLLIWYLYAPYWIDSMSSVRHPANIIMDISPLNFCKIGTHYTYI